MDRMHIVFTFTVYATVAANLHMYDCNTKLCPKDTPFCTSAGCVAKCPENSFANGTNCVTDCGDKLVDNNKCTDKCPIEKNYTVEKVFVSMDGFRKIRICLDSCKSYNKAYVSYINTCVEKCPKNAGFVYKGQCVVKCPDQLVSNGNRCEKRCGYGFFAENRTCVQHCSGELPYKLENVVEDHDPGVTWTTVQQCVSECPFQMVAQNDSCVNQCDDGFFTENKVCVRNCSDMYPYTITIITESRHTTLRKCVVECPYQMVHQYDKCESQCSDGFLNANRICVKRCPADFPYILETNRKCIRECPDEMVLQGMKCQFKCNDNFVKINKTCLQDCPAKLPYTLAINKKSEYWPVDDIVEKQCVSECPDKMVLLNDKCISKCPAKVYERTCVIQCPNEFPYASEICNKGHICCEDTCPNGTFISNTTCYKHCPKFHFNKDCVSDCPYGTYKHQSVCVRECPQNTYIYNGSCVSRCPSAKKVHNRTCVDQCPTTAPFSFNKCIIHIYATSDCYSWKHLYIPDKCLVECPDDTFSLKSTCVKECQHVSFNRVCLNHCPKEAPYIKESMCVNSCEPDYLANGSECIREYMCNLPIKYNGQCLTACPEGTYWVGNALTDNYSKCCVTRKEFIMLIPISSVFLITLLVCFLKYFRFQPPGACRICKELVSIV